MNKLYRAACLAAAVLAVTPARAEIDEQCLVAWKMTVSAHAVGERCKWLDAAAAQRLKAHEDSRYQCAIAKASKAEVDLKAHYSPITRANVKGALNEMPCDAEARKFFDKQLGEAK